jgi:HEPN domain-containing protein/predicted nucleotidyltransferase
MMQKTQTVTIRQIRDALEPALKKAGAAKAVVFGSYARGDADAESDLDLMVILNTDLPFIERWDIIPGLRSRSPVQEMDLLAYTPGEVRRMMEKGSVLLPIVLEEGVTIYDGDPNFGDWWKQQAVLVEKGEDVMKQNPEIVAQRWLRLAKRDLISCSKVLEVGIFETVCFHAQQAAEKSLKAVAYLGGARRVMGHSCCRLVRQLQVQHPSLTVFQESAGLLDQVYTSSRYPDDELEVAPYELFSRGQAEDLMARAREIVDEAGRIIDRSRGPSP